MISHSHAKELIKRGRNGRKKLQNNTYLEPRGEDFAVRLHYTDVVTIHADGTFTLNTGGWSTVTTKERINSYGPARVWSERGDWCISSSDDPCTPPKVQKCRGCKGTGQQHVAASYRYNEYRTVTRTYEYGDGTIANYETSEYVRLETPELISEAHDYECYSCSGTGRQDYGSKPMPVKFFDGIRANGDGSVINADNFERLREPAEVTAARRLLGQHARTVHQERRDRRYSEASRAHTAATRPELPLGLPAREPGNGQGGGQTYTGRIHTDPHDTSAYESGVMGPIDTDSLLTKIDNVLDPASAGSKVGGQFWIPAHP